jgi:hypothetical protein
VLLVVIEELGELAVGSLVDFGLAEPVEPAVLGVEPAVDIELLIGSAWLILLHPLASASRSAIGHLLDRFASQPEELVGRVSPGGDYRGGFFF